MGGVSFLGFTAEECEFIPEAERQRGTVFDRVLFCWPSVFYYNGQELVKTHRIKARDTDVD